MPKGKLDPGESWQETALREVLEETACRAEIERFAGGTIYTVKGRPKVVLFWHMAVSEEGSVRAPTTRSIGSSGSPRRRRSIGSTTKPSATC